MLITLEGLKYTTKKLRKWMKPQKRSVSALSWPGKTWEGIVRTLMPEHSTDPFFFTTLAK